MIQNNISSATNHISFQDATGKVSYSMTNDYMFRAVLQKSELTLKRLIASLLHLSMDKILSVEITNPITLGKSIDEKTFILDVAVVLNNYFRINLEMQVLNEHNWADRSLLYLCRCFTNIPKGSDYSEVHPAIHIGFLNFTPFPDEPEFYATNKMLNIKTHHLFNDKFTLSVVDLTQIQLATKEDRKFRIDHWASLFKATTWEDIKMLAGKNSDLTETAETLYQLNAEEDIRLQCQAREDYYMFKTMTENKMAQLAASLADKDAVIADKNAALADKDAALADKDAALADKNAALADKDAVIAELNAKIRQLEIKH